MKIFVISLPDQHERRATITRQLRTLDLEFEFFDAIRGTADPLPHFAAMSRLQYRLNTRRDPLPGEIGCYASHLALWRKSAELGEPLAILEDDFLAHDNFPDAIRTAGELIGEFGFIRFEPFRRCLLYTSPSPRD